MADTNDQLEDYLRTVRRHLRLGPELERQTLAELRSHLAEKTDELRGAGVPEQFVAETAIRSFGRARTVAQLMYEAHSRGTWDEALLASLPHFAIALLFAFNLWRHPVIGPMTLVTIITVTLIGWWRGKPNWLYSWVGYAMVPLLIGGYQLVQPTLDIYAHYVLRTASAVPLWHVVLIAGYAVGSMWIILSTSERVIKRDWVLTSLMLVPLPIVGAWLYNVNRVGGLLGATPSLVHSWDTSLAYVFTVLAAAALVFIRLRQRIWKAAAVITIGVIASSYLVRDFWEVGFFSLLIIAVALLIFLLLPALLENLLTGDRTEGRATHHG